MFAGKSLGGTLSLVAAVDFPIAALMVGLSLGPLRRALAAAMSWDANAAASGAD